MSSTSNYCCTYCNKQYILKHNYEKHTSTCEFFYKSRQEVTNEIDNHGPVPSMKDMYSLIQDMALRIQRLEKENTNLKQRTNRQSNPLVILKKMKPDITFSKWVKKYMLPDVNMHLQTVFEYTLFDGLQALFKQVFEELSDQSSMPIQYFPNKQNNLYVYETSDDKEGWKLLTNADLNQYVTMIANEFRNQFSIWCDNNQELIDEDPDLFPKYGQKILSEDRLCKSKIKKKLCECLSTDND